MMLRTLSSSGVPAAWTVLESLLLGEVSPRQKLCVRSSLSTLIKTTTAPGGISGQLRITGMPAASNQLERRNCTLPPVLAKGAQVTLPDGSRGTVSYLDPAMRIARVKTSDGRNLTVKQSALTGAPTDLVRC